MLSYYRAVGFSGVGARRRQARLTDIVIARHDSHYSLGRNTDTFVEYYKTFGEGIGLMVRGNLDENDNVNVWHCRPTVLSREAILCEDLDVDKVDGTFIAAVSDVETGNELVFELMNALQFMDKEKTLPNKINVNVGALAESGTVILPVAKDEVSEQIRREEDDFYREMSKKAREGDHEAKELLDIQESEIEEMMRERLLDEDLLSVLESFFMPLEQDDVGYSVLADIEAVAECANTATGERLYRLTLNITGTRLDLCINRNDLVGVPSPGMRFLGCIRLQGKIVF